MSLTKLLKSPIKLFKKEVITFVSIRRYDLGIINESLSYIAVKPSASISALRQKVWHLLDLPDYCEELIILKSAGDVEIALTELRKGNDPQRPYILEVWLPGMRGNSSSVLPNNMIMVKDRSNSNLSNFLTEKLDGSETFGSHSVISNETMPLNKLNTCIYAADFKKSELSCRISTSSIFRLNGRKSKDNFTNLLLKIQSDLCALNNKLAVLENKIAD